MRGCNYTRNSKPEGESKMDKQRICISSPADREQVAAILVKNDYTVRLVKESAGKRTKICVEFWRGDDDA